MAVALLVSTVSANTAPYTAAKFQSVLELSKLQEFTPTDEDLEVYIPDLYEYASTYFELDSNEGMVFRIYGSSMRSELRERTSDDANAAWSVTDSYTMTGTIAIPEQEDGLEEVTIMQVHCGSAPLLRIS